MASIETTHKETGRAQRITQFIADAAFPCVGAKSALNRERLKIATFSRLGSPRSTAALYQSLLDYSKAYPEPGTQPVSFVAVFKDLGGDELAFERGLWRQLQFLHDLDRARGQAWAGGVSSDPAREDFSFSIGGRAFFIVGMHPQASRVARRTPYPCLVFNFHDQFEALKASGKYSGMQSAVRARELRLQGSINPVLSRFGDASEARQYSGRAVEDNWECPFHSGRMNHA